MTWEKVRLENVCTIIEDNLQNQSIIITIGYSIMIEEKLRWFRCNATVDSLTEDLLN
jgi:hypothetical protein